ncbi:MAG: thiamine phosphate synthase [Candidatus Poribacteria bacterium]|nr:thiamine phosphate synthase [Candidatus Poribacteria bacterium]
MEILGRYQLIDFRLYVITDRRRCHPTPLLDQVQRLLDLGVSAVQLREKDLPESEFRQLTESVLRLANDYQTKVFVNSHLELARQTGVDGVHLPTKLVDLIGKAKANELLVGSSAHSLAEAQQQERMGADFVTFSPIFPTPSKPGHVIGVESLAQVCQKLEIPVFALGGVKTNHITTCLQAGAHGVAVMSGMMSTKQVIKSYMEGFK